MVERVIGVDHHVPPARSFQGGEIGIAVERPQAQDIREEGKAGIDVPYEQVDSQPDQGLCKFRARHPRRACALARHARLSSSSTCRTCVITSLPTGP